MRNRQMPRRLIQLYIGLLLFGFSLALIIRAELGVAPWDVLHQGLARTIGLTIGAWAVIVSLLLLLLWIPLRQRPGIGTVSNALLVGVAIDASLLLLPDELPGLPLRIVALAAGVGLNAIATAMYIGARLGPGPRDGLMTGIAARGHSVRAVRTGIEIVVLTTGFLLGGTVGLGTVVFALGIGPLVHPLLPRFVVPERPLPVTPLPEPA